MEKYKIELTEKEMSSVFIAIIKTNTDMNKEIELLSIKIDKACFDKAMQLIAKRDILIDRRKLLFSTCDKFKTSFDDK